MKYISNKVYKLEKQQYEVIFHIINAWEEEFWQEGNPVKERVSYTGRLCFSRQLFCHLNFILAKTLDSLLDKELGKKHPMLSLNPALAPEEIKKQAEEELLDKLLSDESLLYEGRPMLEEYINRAIIQQTKMTNSLLGRIDKDKADIEKELLEGRKLGQILEISCDKADLHQDGQQACIVTCSGGRFVYKPHSLMTDCALREMTEELYRDITFIPKPLDKGDYGYTQFVENCPAESSEEAKKLFYRLGGLASIAAAFGTTDLHRENVLCYSGFPVMVDAETFLSIDFKENFEAKNTFMQVPSSDDFNYDFSKSVFISGMLPHLVNGENLSPLLYDGKDSMLPFVEGSMKTVYEFEEDFFKGFRDTYDYSCSNKDRLLYYVKKLEKCRFRILLKNTDDYARILQRFYAPKLVASREAADEWLDKLLHPKRENFCDISEEIFDVVLSVARAEGDAYLRGDVPFFQFEGAGRGLYADGKCIAEGFANKSACDRARERIYRMNPDERNFEESLLRQSLRCAHIKTETHEKQDNEKEQITVSENKEENLRKIDKAVEDIFAKIKNLKVESPSGEAGWFDHTGDTDSFGCLMLDAGMGYAGLGEFFTEYYALKHDREALELADIVMDKLEKKIEIIKKSGNMLYIPGCLGILEIGGMIRFCLLYADHIDEEKGLKNALGITKLCQSLDIARINDADFYGGMSGLLYVLSKDKRLYEKEEVRQLIGALSHRILALKNLETGQGILSWDTISKKRPISGLGHGNAGIGLALAAAAKVTDDKDVMNGAMDAFRLEHLLYDEKFKTWPDFRISSVAAGYMHGLCSGAPGMILAYTRLKSLGVDDFDEDLKRALDFTLSTGPSQRDHYCCGNGAILESLIEAGNRLGDDEYTDEALKRASFIVKRRDLKQKYSFLPEGYVNYEPLGQLNGLSGLGHVFLRLLKPELEGLLV